MDCHEAIHCNACHKPRLHQVVDDEAETDFDNITPESQDHWLTRCTCIKKGSKQIPQAFSRENMRKFRYKSENVLGTIHGFTKHYYMDFAISRIEGVCRNTGDEDALDEV